MTQAAALPRSRSRLRYWALRAGLVFVLLLALGIIIVQAVLWTDIPRSIVINQVERELGVTLSARTLSTGWFGDTELTDVTVTLPLAEDAFFKVPTLRLKHTALPLLALGAKLQFRSIELDGPTLVLNQDASGRWNVQDLLELLSRTSGASSSQAQAATSTRASAPALPNVKIENALLILSDNKHRKAAVNGLNVNGYADSPLTWQCSVDAAKQLQVNLRVAPGDAWKHKITFQMQDLQAWTQDWVQQWPTDAMVKGSWAGQLLGSGPTQVLSGQLAIDQAQADDVVVQGQMFATAGNGGASIRPAGLEISSPTRGLPPVRFDDGTVAVDAAGMRLESVHANAAQGLVDINGKYLFADGSASLSTVWQHLTFHRTVSTDGHLNMTLAEPWRGQPSINADLETTGVTPSGAWHTKVGVVGSGSSWADIAWVINAPELKYTPDNGHAYLLRDASAELATDRGQVNLTSLNLGAALPATADGGYDTKRGHWWFNLVGRQWPVPNDASEPFDLDLQTQGDFVSATPTRASAYVIKLQRLDVLSGETEVTADASYHSDQHKPLDVNLYISDRRNILPVETVSLATTLPTAEPTLAGQPLVRGQLNGEIHLRGTLDQLNLVEHSFLSARQLQLHNQKMGDLRIAVEGQADRDGLDIHSTQLKLLGGDWQFKVYWKLGQDSLGVLLSVKDLPLSQLANMPDGNGAAAHGIVVGGTVEGVATASIYRPHRDQVQVYGGFTANHVTIGMLKNTPLGPTTQPILEADQITVDPQPLLHNGLASVQHIHVRGSQGQAEASISADIVHLKQVDTALAVQDWRVPLGPAATARLTSFKSLLNVNLTNPSRPSAVGSVEVHAAADYLSKGEFIAKSAATLSLHAVIDQRTINVDSAKIDALGGSAIGNAAVDLDHLDRTTANAALADLRADAIRPFVALLGHEKELSGTFAGSVALAPSTNAHPLGPSQWALNIHSQGARYRSLNVGDFNAYGYADLNTLLLSRPNDSNSGVVLDDSRPSTLDIAGGQLTLWGRLTHIGNFAPQTMVIIGMQHLSLDQLAHAGDPKMRPVNGYADGQVEVVGNLRYKDGLFGSGNLKLYDANLANVGLVDALYGMTHFGGSSSSQGYGDVEFRLEGTTLLVDHIYYFNSGLNAFGTMTIDDIFNAPASPLQGSVGASLQPLANIQLPFFADANQILTALQSNMVTAFITGTISKVHVQPVAFADVNGSFKTMVSSDVQNAHH